MRRDSVALGTSEYMAPEQATGMVREIDGRTDVFGLGATMFRVLSGRAIHGDVADARLLIAAATERASSLALWAPDVPSEVCDVRDVVDRPLAFHKVERYPDAATIRGDVRAVRAGRLPPYVVAVEEGPIPAGAPLPRR
ncbi:hypothetical protein [Sorangium sp. So ce124]|uniref:hypothetical protein n=1 Tax=Sorangium sp. So ce124 TaxID=3133280 RepID=UPI003F63AF26